MESIKAFKNDKPREGVLARLLNGTASGELCQFKGWFRKNRIKAKCVRIDLDEYSGEVTEIKHLPQKYLLCRTPLKKLWIGNKKKSCIKDTVPFPRSAGRPHAF